jgi:transposase
MKRFFLKPFREKEENYYQFTHEVDLDYNDMFKFTTEIFDNPAWHETSKKKSQTLI